MTTCSPHRSDAMLRVLVRVALLALTSGTHHLPDGLDGSTEAEEGRRAIAEAHDATLADGDLPEIAERLVAGLTQLAAQGFDPLRLYTLATIARVEGRPAISKPVTLGDNVIRLPLPVSPTLSEPKVRTGDDWDAEEIETGRIRLYCFLAYALDGILRFLPGQRGKRGSVWQEAADLQHMLERFVGSAKYVDGTLTIRDATKHEIRDEDDLARRWLRLEETLARDGIGTFELSQLVRHEFPIVAFDGREVVIGKTRWTRRTRRYSSPTGRPKR
ncbi:MAG: hypothetical protein LWW93_15100 [Hyphomicrobiales bacterium]|nr:hypothetical protein [Hyphomicrobiales bacterium]